MSLRPDDHRSSRSRSKSPGRTRERSRSRSRVVDEDRAFANDPRLTTSHGGAQPPPISTPQYEIRQPGLSSYATPAQFLSGASAPGQQQRANNEMEGYTMGGYTDLPPHERPGYIPPSSAGAPQPQQSNMQYAQPGQPGQSAQWSYTATPINSGPPQQPYRTNSSGGYQQQPVNYQYAQPEGLKYTAKPITTQNAPPPPQVRHRASSSVSSPTILSPTHGVTAMPLPQQYYPPPPTGPSQSSKKSDRYDPDLAYGIDNARVVEHKPGGGKYGAPPSPGLRPERLSTHAPHSPGLTPRMDRLSVSGNRPTLQPVIPGAFPGADSGYGGLPPPSPMMEAYHGTYQSISPMPSPLMRPLDDDIDDLPPLEGRDEKKKSKKHRHRSSSNVSHGHSSSLSVSSSKKDRERSRSRVGDDKREKEKDKGSKRVKIYDGEDDAHALLGALASREPDANTLIDILPALSHDQMMDLRDEYKRICKVQGRGVNLAKHIKMKMGNGNFAKICHVTALGRWESEAYWANYWYQSSSSKRELLIECLMGRPKWEVREIKDAFRDKRYGDSLEDCMKAELKADKFRDAVLAVLEEKKPSLPRSSREYSRGEREEPSPAVDAMVLYDLVRGSGGERDILQIICTRDEAWILSCWQKYKETFRRNLAEDILDKSNNLVGEVCAHILNGAINKPARDAILLRHALNDLMDQDSAKAHSSRHERQHRHELLTSRLVRVHWDRLHLSHVKDYYRKEYRVELEDDVEDATRGDFREFCLALCDVGLGTGR